MAWKANATLKSLRVLLILSQRQWSANLELLSSRYKTTLCEKKVSPLASSPVTIPWPRSATTQFSIHAICWLPRSRTLISIHNGELVGSRRNYQGRRSVASLAIIIAGPYFSNRGLSKGHLYTLRGLLLGTVHDLGFWIVSDNQTQKVPMAFGKPFLRTYSTLFYFISQGMRFVIGLKCLA